MKKLIAMLLAVVMVMAMAACAPADKDNTTAPSTTAPTTEPTTEPTNPSDPADPDDGVMTYEEFVAAELESAVCIETYVQATQSWYQDAINVYCQGPDGAYYAYKLVCSEADAAKLVPGTKIRITGYKTEWSGEVEIAEGGTFEFVEGGDTYIVDDVRDVTDLVGTDELLAHQNEKVCFTGMTVVASTDANGNEAAFLYGWDGSGSADSDSDLYFTASIGDKTCTFVIEYYLCGPDTDAYKAVQGLKVGDTIDLEGFLYWYEGAQPHITSVTVA